MTSPLFSRNLCKILSLTLLPLVVLGGTMSPVSAAPDKPAKSSKATKGKKKAKKKGKKGKKAKKVANAAKKAGQEKEKAGGDVLIADAKTPFDKLFNQAIQWVQEGTYGPDGIRVNGKSLFEYAASRGQLAAMKLLVEAGSEVKAIESCVPAIASGSVECIKYMQELGIPLCALGRGCMTKALMSATSSGSVACVSYVYKQLLPNIRPDKGNLSLEWLRYAALESGSPDMVAFWQEKGVRPQKNDVLFAVASGNMKLLESMRDAVDSTNFSQKVDVWATCGAAYTMMAAKSGNHEMLKYIVEKGASVQDAPKEFCHDLRFSGTVMSPILHAALSGSLECVKYLESKGARPVDTVGLSLLEAAVNSGNLELVRYLVSKEKPNKRTNDALCLAARLGNGDIVRYLVEECSADVKTTGAARTYVRSSLNAFYAALVHQHIGSPLLQAAGFGHMELVKYLMDKGADVNAVQKGNNIYWDSSALVAASFGQPHVLKFLLEKASFASEEDKNHLFMRAAEGCSLACLKLIFEEKVDVNAEIQEDEYKWRAFGQACSSRNPGRMACIRFLLDNGAKPTPDELLSTLFDEERLIKAHDIKAIDDVDRLQLLLCGAGESGRLDVAKFLVDNGVVINPEVRYHSGDALRSTVLAACSYMLPGHLECIRYFTSKGLRLDKDELDKLVAGEVLFDDYYAPEPLRKVLQETHQ